MNLGFKSQCVPSYRVLSEEQILTLHRATLEVLETVGVRVHHSQAIALLAEAGCQIHEENRVTLPNWLVEDAIRSAPSRITIYDRRGEPAMFLEGSNVYFGLGTDLLQSYDMRTGELRNSCLQDITDAAIVSDYCSEIDFIASQAHPREITPNMAFIDSFKALVTHSTKPIYTTAATSEDLGYIIEMAEVVAGGEAQLRTKPFIMHYAEPISPLTHSKGALSKLFLCADKGVPLNYVPALLMGASGPVTLAGACVVANAEALSGLVIQQLRAKGSPMISGFSVTPMDMRTGTTVYGSPDERLTHSACVDMYHYYGLPVWGEAGCSDAKLVDEQAAIESTAQILLAAMEGCNLVHDVGYLGQGLIGSPAAIVMCDEIISYVKRITRGFDVDREHLALDVIAEIGPGGNFLTHDHTAQYVREEFWQPKQIDRQNPETWAQNGGRRYSDVVAEKALEILETHRPEPLQDDLLARLDEIRAKAAAALEGKFLAA